MMGKITWIARFLCAVTVGLLAWLTLGLARLPENEVILTARPLTDSVTSFPAARSGFDFFVKHRLRGELDPSSIASSNVLIHTYLGHYQVEADGSFDLPVFRAVEIFVQTEGEAPDIPVPRIADVILHRQALLPGGWAVISILVLSAFYFYSLSSRRLSRKQVLDRITLLASIVVVFLLAALLFQVLNPILYGQKPWHLYPPHLTREFDIYPEVAPGLPRGRVRFMTNSEGLRARERNLEDWDSVTSILAIGASTTAGTHLGEEKHWPRVLEKTLGESGAGEVWVGNAGRPAYNTEALAVVARNYIPRIKPKYVVLLTGFNEGLVPRTTASKGLIPSLKEMHRQDFEAISKRIAILRLLYYNLFYRRTLSPHDIDLRGSNLWLAAARERRQRQALISPPKDWNWDHLDLAYFGDLLEEIHDVSEQAGAKLVLCTQPTIYGEDMSQEETDLLWMTGNFTGRSMRARMDLINDKIREVGERQSIPVVDLDRNLPRSAEVFYDDCHFNENGARRVADEIYRYFAEELGLPGGRP